MSVPRRARSWLALLALADVLLAVALLAVPPYYAVSAGPLARPARVLECSLDARGVTFLTRDAQQRVWSVSVPFDPRANPTRTQQEVEPTRTHPRCDLLADVELLRGSRHGGNTQYRFAREGASLKVSQGFGRSSAAFELESRRAHARGLYDAELDPRSVVMLHRADGVYVLDARGTRVAFDLDSGQPRAKERSIAERVTAQVGWMGLLAFTLVPAIAHALMAWMIARTRRDPMDRLANVLALGALLLMSISVWTTWVALRPAV